jgi:serine/threonine protein kinase
LSRQPTARAGKKLGRYRIERELGRGGMGVVYVAEDENTGRLIALKTTSVAGLGGAEKSRNQRRQRFVREVKALTQVNHHNVVHVIDAGEADDPDLGWLLFYSMEYVEGETLAQLVQRRGPLDPGAGAAVCMQVAAGLGAAHRAGIVHRDVKPANIFISLDSRALIGDFGICKIEGQTQITRRDQLVGTPNYLAPEQILGDPVSPATDVFAMGALFYVITMNRPLRSHVDAAALLASAQSNEPRERMLSERKVPEGLRLVIARCLERDPKKRWTDGQHLADALAEWATRIPSLRDETAHDPTADSTSTSDRSSPFASLPSAPSGDVQEMPAAFADPKDVEAAARAMLDEVAQRESSSRKNEKLERREEKRRAEEKPLPVAKTESTVMFNLRALEEEQQKAKNPLPVARTESTVVFKLRGGDEDEHDETERLPASPGVGEAPNTQPSTRLDETKLGVLPSTNVLGGDTVSEEDAPLPKRKRREAARSLPADALPFRLPQLSRPAWIGISGASGALLGILMVLALAPPSHSTKEASAAPREPADATAPAIEARPRPALCAAANESVTISDKDAAQAKKLLDEANVLSQQGAQLKELREKLEESIKYNPLEPATFWMLAQVYAKDGRELDADQAYDCVCHIVPTSSQCQAVKRMRAR